MLAATRTRLRDTGIHWGANGIHHLEGIIARGSKVGDVPVFQSSDFPWAREIEDHWKDIRGELDRILGDFDRIPAFHQLSRDQAVLSSDGGWRTYFFYAFGFKAEDHCAECPETARWLESIPGMTTAFFSIFTPGERLPPHRGTFKGILRYHLGLLVPWPEDKVGIRVHDQVCHWREGESLIFDDTYQHEAWNDTDSTRVVLFVDFIRPLRFPASAVNWLVIQAIKHSPFVKDAVANYKAWDKGLDRRD
jgi:beta-hydroxylase